MTLHNLEIEQAVLGMMLMNPETCQPVAGKFIADCFSHPLHALIYQTIADLLGGGASVNAVVVEQKIKNHADFLKGEPDYLRRLVLAAGSPLLLKDYASILHDLSRKRLLQAACQQTLLDLERPIPAEQVALGLEETRLAVTAAGYSSLLKRERDVMNSVWQDIEHRAAPVSTGLKRLDAAMDGGMHARRAYGVMARKKMGKTVLAATIAKNVADAGVPVLFIAAEMGEKEIQERVACRTMGVYPSAFRSEYRYSQDFSSKFAEACGKASDNLIYASVPGIRFDQLRQLIPAAITLHKIKGFILDYWQLVGGKQGKASEREHLDEVAQWLADYARENNLWCLVMGQENQEGNSRGGEGMRLAFDQVYSLCGEPESRDRWMEMRDTRYTKWLDVGTEENPALCIEEKGPYMAEYELIQSTLQPTVYSKYNQGNA